LNNSPKRQRGVVDFVGFPGKLTPRSRFALTMFDFFNGLLAYPDAKPVSNLWRVNFDELAGRLP
jgi:hypothetical protein